MKIDEIKGEIENLELSEKLLLVEEIWDSIAASNRMLPMPEWQKEELDKRFQAYKDGKLELHGWKAAHDELRVKCK